MKKVMEYSTNGKVTNEQKTLIQKTIMGLLAGFPKFQANQKVNLHSKAVGEAINAVFWVVNVKKIKFHVFFKKILTGNPRNAHQELR